MKISYILPANACMYLYVKTIFSTTLCNKHLPPRALPIKKLGSAPGFHRFVFPYFQESLNSTLTQVLGKYCSRLG